VRVCGEPGRDRCTYLLIELGNLVLGAVLNRHDDEDKISKLDAMKESEEREEIG